MRFAHPEDRYRLRKRSVVALVVMAMTVLPATPAFAELSEAEKQAIEAEKKAAELAAEGGQDQQPDEPQPDEQELTEAEKKAIEAAKKAAEDQGGQQDAPGGAAKASLNGTIGAIGTNSITVGIFPDSTFGVNGGTSITFNGQVSNLIRLHIGDRISVQYDPETLVATSIEAEGMFWGPAIYTGVATVSFVGLIGHWPGRSYGMHAGGAGVKLGPGTQVTVNGVPATYMDIQVGDTVDYVQNSLDLKAHTVKVTR